MCARVFLCSHQRFPRGDAGANYLQYLGLALKEAGYEPVMVSEKGRRDWCRCTQGRLFYRGLELVIPTGASSKIGIALEDRYTGWIPYAREIEAMHPTREDVLLIYTHKRWFAAGLRRYAGFRGMKAVITPVEYLMPTSFSGGEKGAEYKRYSKLVEREIPKYDVVLPISNYLAQVFRDKGKECRVIPIMADVDEYNETFHKDFSGKRKLVFPARGAMKDDVEGMLRSLAELEDDILGNIEFHITHFNNGRERIHIAMESIEDPRKKALLENALVYHERLEYGDLVELYRDMHFLLLIREKNQQMLAGFPSKLPETMAFGIVPIATEMGDYAQFYLRDGVDSILIREQGVEACTAAIARALRMDDEALRQMSYAAYTTARERFDYHNWVGFLKRELA